MQLPCIKFQHLTPDAHIRAGGIIGYNHVRTIGYPLRAAWQLDERRKAAKDAACRLYFLPTPVGLFAAASMQALGWLATHAAALRPVWSMLHIGAAAMGLMLLIWARQPLWLETGARRVWARVRAASGRWGLAAPLAIGFVWALLPCGLLYSAVLVAALTGDALQGAAAMALFAAGSGLSLLAGPWLLLRLGVNGRGPWSMRLAGLALMLTALWGLWHGLVHQQAPWCVAP